MLPRGSSKVASTELGMPCQWREARAGYPSCSFPARSRHTKRDLKKNSSPRMVAAASKAVWQASGCTACRSTGVRAATPAAPQPRLGSALCPGSCPGWAGQRSQRPPPCTSQCLGSAVLVEEAGTNSGCCQPPAEGSQGARERHRAARHSPPRW